MKRSNLPAIAGYIPRPRIDALVQKGLDYALVLVMAGPGYGKTLSVAHTLRQADIRLAYVRVSNIRTSANEFWQDLIAAAKAELPLYAKKLEELGFPQTVSNFEQFIKITGEAARAGRRLVFVVDNYERIQDNSITRFLNELIDADVPSFTMFILCNTMLPFAQVLPAAGQFRITDEHLAFTVEEAALMFEQYGVDAPMDVVQRAVAVTDGWPLGLRLVCESSPDNPERISSRLPIQMIADLFQQHYFAKYPKDIQTQLVLFSLLPQFSMEMIQQKMDTPVEELAYLLMQHPFVSFNHENGLFVFQTMYHDFLRQRQNLLSMEAKNTCNVFAGEWFLAHDMTQEAMDCFWQAGDYDRFMHAVYAMPKVRKTVELTNPVLQRLEYIPRSYADQNPGVDYARAFMYFNAADTQRARELFLQVEQQLLQMQDGEQKRLMLGDIYAALGDIASFRGEDTGLAWIKKAYELVPNGTRIHCPDVLVLGDNSAFYLPNGEAGQLERMVAYFFEYAKYADAVKNGSGDGYEFLFAGEAAYYREDMKKATQMFNSAIMKAKWAGQHDILLNALWNLGRIEVYYGNHKKALQRLEEIEAYVEDNKLIGLHELRDSFVFWFYWRLGDIAKVPRWFADTMSAPQISPTSMIKKHVIGAYYLYSIGEMEKSYALVLQLQQMLNNQGRWPERFSVHIIKALHHMHEDEPARCEAAFAKAYEMVYANDLKYCLSGFGKEMMNLLKYLRKQPMDAYDTPWLDAVYLGSSSMAKRLQVMQTAYKGRRTAGQSSIMLTKRENEVLRFLAQGLTQQEIGQVMGISKNGVKKHISNIYFKLGATNRADAIHIATVNKLVDVINN
ncbi:LuxR C-terminal-related transcriptional regulator [Eubacteriales bacterium OttesenSCG-928-N14]|nr:LuxR C-terminal-related transcriptional regulator [Eubacteriales bacterium OttesenSCG-928-N14]